MCIPETPAKRGPAAPSIPGSLVSPTPARPAHCNRRRQVAQKSTPWPAAEPEEATDMPEPPTFGRYAEIPYDQMTPEQQEAYRFAVETRGPLGGPNKIWVHNPKLAKVAAPFGGHFHAGHYSLSEREREIAVVIINSKWHSAYPTAAHERRGKEMG